MIVEKEPRDGSAVGRLKRADGHGAQPPLNVTSPRRPRLRSEAHHVGFCLARLRIVHINFLQPPAYVIAWCLRREAWPLAGRENAVDHADWNIDVGGEEDVRLQPLTTRSIDDTMQGRP